MFSVDFEVRDYECDQQGIVNNAVYMNYLQHARHLYGISCGLNWLDLSRRGIDLVIRRAEVDYFKPLHPGDNIRVSVESRRKGKFRFYFWQQIVLLPQEVPVLNALMTVACVVDGKPAAPPEIDQWFGAP